MKNLKGLFTVVFTVVCLFAGSQLFYGCDQQIDIVNSSTPVDTSSHRAVMGIGGVVLDASVSSVWIRTNVYTGFSSSASPNQSQITQRRWTVRDHATGLIVYQSLADWGTTYLAPDTLDVEVMITWSGGTNDTAGRRVTVMIGDSTITPGNPGDISKVSTRLLNNGQREYVHNLPFSRMGINNGNFDNVNIIRNPNFVPTTQNVTLFDPQNARWTMNAYDRDSARFNYIGRLSQNNWSLAYSPMSSWAMPGANENFNFYGIVYEGGNWYRYGQLGAVVLPGQFGDTYSGPIRIEIIGDSVIFHMQIRLIPNISMYPNVTPTYAFKTASGWVTYRNMVVANSSGYGRGGCRITELVDGIAEFRFQQPGNNSAPQTGVIWNADRQSFAVQLVIPRPGEPVKQWKLYGKSASGVLVVLAIQ